MPTIETLTAELREALAALPTLDIHTHLVGGRLAARGLHDVLLYHMVISDLYSAGCPSGGRLTEYPGWATPEEAEQRIVEAIPFLPHIKNTSTFWGVRTILRDLYDWQEPVTADNWRRLDALIRERADDRSWQRSILDRAGIRRSCTEWARRGAGADDDRLQYSLEWAMFTRCQWGEHDTAVYELERAWGQPPQSPTPIGKRPATERVIRSLADVHAAIRHYVDTIPYDRVISTATTHSSDIDYRIVSDAEMEAALARRATATAADRDTYASYINEHFLTALEEKSGGRILFQFALGAEPLPHETGSRIRQDAIAQLAALVGRHPGLRFQCFLASRHANQSLCTLCRELPNLSLAAYWWHNFFPESIRQVMTDRLDMVATNKTVGFFSDAYCVEWSYAKLAIVKEQMAAVLAGKVALGQYTKDDAVDIARRLLYQTARDLNGLVPHDEPAAEARPRSRVETAAAR